MKQSVMVGAPLIMVLLLASPSWGQGSAIGGVLKTADKLQQDVQKKQGASMTGPADKSEKVSPGKVDSDAPEEFTKTDSGLQYRILRKSDKKKPKATDSVVAHYKGWLDSKQIFDSSYRRGQPIPFPLNRVIAGWTEGLQLIGEGGMIELDIPHELGYGERGTPGGPIPPRARLHFLVELVEIK
ncbi:putative FKBP-type peptidyl-prolyl cis-trans isomerase [Stieleria maiorica]|uniref:Peptidyl-prolyl cis-trans isomerase n=2 Tax=Stieleria maiorica TaxID=2795974 RepID=A0A5B9MFZ7_9BACT|nr:putative FKBP-type peptidyl-prolyl cis-trans isomerase [Stieleria maiorica]